MIRTDRRIAGDAPVDSTAEPARRSTLPPPVWASPTPVGSRSPQPLARPLPRGSGSRAEEAWLRARVEEARRSGDTTALRLPCIELARWLASRDRSLNEAVELATVALSLGPGDLDLRRELSAWLESLGDAAQAAAVLKPVAAAADVESADVAFVLVRAGTLKARAGDGPGAMAAFEAALAIDENDALPAELLGALAGWQTHGASALAAEAYVEGARRRSAQWQHDAVSDDLWRAVAADATSEMATEVLARTLERRGRGAAADQVRRTHAQALARVDVALSAAAQIRRRASALAAGDSMRALGAMLDELVDGGVGGQPGPAPDAWLLEVGVPEDLLSAVRGALVGDLRAQARGLERVANAFSTSKARGVLFSAAADRYLSVGEAQAARLAAQQAVSVDGTDARSLATLANVVAGERDPGALRALERAIAAVGPQSRWCFALSDALDAVGDAQLAIAWAQRCVTLQPGDMHAIETLLERLLRGGDPGRLGDALAWLLSQPLPLESVAAPFGRALQELSRLDVNRAVIVARRGLDVFGPKSPPVRAAMLQAATGACDDAFVAAIFERWLSCGVEGSDRQKLLVGLAELYERLGDEEAEARVVAMAMRDGARSSAIEAHLDRLMGRPASPDARLYRLEAQAHRLSARNDAEASALAWRELGAALWDVAGDRVGAIAAWQRAARTAPAGGHAALAVDVVTFAEPGFALEYLRQLVDSERDDPTAASMAADVARAVLSLGEARMALDVAARGVARNPSSADALGVAEACTQQTRDFATLSGLYDLVADRALGRFGRRAAHYRGARFFERQGDRALGLKHAVQAFKALPSEGSSFHLLARAAERAGDRSEAVRTVEQVADGALRSDVRSAWLLRAASVAGDDADGPRQRVDLLLRAMIAGPAVVTLSLLHDATALLLRHEPNEREAIELRYRRAALSVTAGAHGPEGARIAIAWARLALDMFSDADAGLSLLERAFASDADVEAFAGLTTGSCAVMARAPNVAERVASMLTAAEGGTVRAGPAAWRVLAEVAAAAEDEALRARATVGASLCDPDDAEAVVAADAGIRAFPELGRRSGMSLTHERRSEALVAVARARAVSAAHEEAARLLERAVDLVEGAARAALEREARAAWAAAGRTTDETRVPVDDDEQGTPEVRAERWAEVAERRESRGDAPGAVAALQEACKLDPQSLGRWSALERVAESANDDQARILALEEMAKRVDRDGRVAVSKRLARAHADRNDRDAAERVWRQVLALDPADEEADKAVEAAIVGDNRFSDLAGHLAARAARLAADPRQAEALRAVRLRRAAILEQRLGRVQDACEELTALLAAAPENQGALRYLADLQERRGEHAEAASLWARASAVERDSAERDTLEVRAGRAANAAGEFAAALRHARAVLERRPGDLAALELRCEASRALGQDDELGEALEQLATECPPSARSKLLVDAALAAARGGDLDIALARARLAAEAAPEQATPQLLARGLEYRRRGAGGVDDARTTLTQLSRVEGSMGGDDAALRSFLLAEATDVVEGLGAGLQELERARGLVGAHPLVGLGLAERLAARGQTEGAIEAYRVALGGPLLGLRSTGAVAIAAADVAIRANRLREAAQFLDVAERHEESSGAAKTRRAQLERASAPEAPPPTGVEVRPRTEDLRIAIHDAASVAERAHAQLVMARAKIERGETRAAEPLLREALADGLAEAGDMLADLLATSRDRHRDVVQVRYQQVVLEPGNTERLSALASAALADDDSVYANAVEHVLGAFGPRDEAREAPLLAAQPEQPGVFAFLTRPSMDSAGEALALLWEGGWQLFAREAASYSVTGLERVVPGPSSTVARLYDAAIRVLDAPRIPLFVRAVVGPPSFQLALMQTPSVILTGDLRTDSPQVRFELGRGMSAAIAQNVLRLGLSPGEGRVVLDALLGAFGPPEQSGHLHSPSARMAESFWHLLPPRTQRRMQRLLGGGLVPDYDALVRLAQQSGRRVGMFLAGDFGHAARVTLAECAPHVPIARVADLRSACQEVPQLADLLRLAVSPEYASARWHRGDAPSGRFSLF